MSNAEIDAAIALHEAAADALRSLKRMRARSLSTPTAPRLRERSPSRPLADSARAACAIFALPCH